MITVNIAAASDGEKLSTFMIFIKSRNSRKDIIIMETNRSLLEQIAFTNLFSTLEQSFCITDLIILCVVYKAFSVRIISYLCNIVVVMPRVNFRFGNVSIEGTNPPTLTQLTESAKERNIQGPPNYRQGAEEVIEGNNYIFIRYLKEISEEVMAFNENDDVVQKEQFRARAMRFLLLENGNYAFESRQQVSDSDAIEYLLEDFGNSFDLSRYSNLNLNQMREFYKKRPEIRRIKVENIGKREPNPTWPEEDIEEIVDETGKEAESGEFSVKRTNNNLKNVDIIDKGYARLSDLPFIRARNSTGAIQELTDNGRFTFTYPSELDDSEQSQRIHDTAINILRELFDRQ